MVIRYFNFLPKDAIDIRKAVFVKEQGFVHEFDDVDDDAMHMICYEDKDPVATCRVFYNTKLESYVIGRVAVYKKYRGKSYGRIMIENAEKYIMKHGGNGVSLASEDTALGFYKKQGYQEIGRTYMEDGCLHLWVSKKLEKN